MVVKDDTPGRAVWKFVKDDKFIYKRSNIAGLKYFFTVRDIHKFDVYTRNYLESGWLYQFTNVPQDHCSCGRMYSDTPDGSLVKWQDSAFYPKTKTEDVLNIMRSPILCIVCYYKKELEQGRFCPKWVKDRLEN